MFAPSANPPTGSTFHPPLARQTLAASSTVDVSAAASRSRSGLWVAGDVAKTAHAGQTSKTSLASKRLYRMRRTLPYLAPASGAVMHWCFMCATICGRIMRRLPFLPFALAISLGASAATGCGGSDVTPILSVPDAAGSTSPGDAGSDATPEATGSPDASLEARADAGSDAPGEGSEPDATADAATLSDTGLPDVGPDACAIADGAVPDAPIGDTGATTASCLACIDASCATQAAACNGDCACASQAVAVFTCAAGGQSVAGCLASTPGGTAFDALAACVAFSCRTACGF
jgi:hypothetical protein